MLSALRPMLFALCTLRYALCALTFDLLKPLNLSKLKKQIISTFMAFEPEKIIIYGSLSGKDWDEWSDVDVIVVYSSDKPFMARLRELYMSWDIPKAVDILAYTPSEFDEMSSSSFFIQKAVLEGEVIYEKGK